VPHDRPVTASQPSPPLGADSRPLACRLDTAHLVKHRQHPVDLPQEVHCRRACLGDALGVGPDFRRERLGGVGLGPVCCECDIERTGTAQRQGASDPEALDAVDELVDSFGPTGKPTPSGVGS